ncbi:hypothetical protein M0805_008104 [Coniferiporia weirii]|nr:hypothetical protein M0805_008104 [Coniferiporia weirii]
MFIATFLMLSCVPVLCFAGTSLFIIGTLLFASLACSLFVGAAIITVLGMALLGTLLIISFFSVFLTLFAVATYLAARLLFLLRTQDSMREGVVLWMSELKNHVYSRLVWGPASLKQDQFSSAVFNDNEKPASMGSTDALEDESYKGRDETSVKMEQ